MWDSVPEGKTLILQSVREYMCKYVCVTLACLCLRGPKLSFRYLERK